MAGKPSHRLSDAARQLWIAFYDAVERDLGEAGAPRPIRAFGAKMTEHAGRLAAMLAATLAAYDDPAPKIPPS